MFPKHPELSQDRKLVSDIKFIQETYQQQDRSLSHDSELLSDAPEGVVLENRSKPGRKYAPLLELPNVLLDLDAEDSPYVRPFDKETDGLEQQLKWGFDPVLAEVEEQLPRYQHEFKAEEMAMFKAARRPLGPQAISDHDILAVALLGVRDPMQQGSETLDETSSPSQNDPQTYKSRSYVRLRAHGIPQSTLDQGPSEIIPFMLHRQRLAAQNLDKTSETRKYLSKMLDSSRVKHEVRQCDNLSDLRRVVARISRPSCTLKVSSDCLDSVSQRCYELCPIKDLRNIHGNPASSELMEFLKFVHNITINQLLSGHALHPAMTRFGLQLACRCGLIPPILQYLQLCLSMDFIEGFKSYSERIGIQTQAARGILHALEQTDTTSIGTRQQLLKLLFGIGPDQDSLEPSLLGLNARVDGIDHPIKLQLRLQLLGQLGALRLLWRSGPGSDEAILVDAFHRFARITYGVGGLDITTTSDDADFGSNVLLDLQTMNAVETYHTQVRPSSSASAAPVPTISELVSSEDIIAAFNEQDIHDAMHRFNELLRRAAEDWRSLQQGEVTDRAGLPVADNDDGAYPPTG